MFKCKCGKWTNLGLLCSSCAGLDSDFSYDDVEMPLVEGDKKIKIEENDDDSVQV